VSELGIQQLLLVAGSSAEAASSWRLLIADRYTHIPGLSRFTFED
jgi:hypothetical protein